MPHSLSSPPRRAFLAGSLAAGAALALAGCATPGQFDLTEAIRRLLLLSSERAFARLTAPGGYWDQQVARANLTRSFGGRGDTLGSILTSAVFKARLEDVAADLAVEASARAAPIVADAVRTIGFANTVALIRGGRSAATDYLRGEIGARLLDALVPGVADGLRIARDPVVGQLIAGLTGVDVTGLARSFAGGVEDAIWSAIGDEEAAIRADPAATRDPVLIGVFGAGSLLR